MGRNPVMFSRGKNTSPALGLLLKQLYRTARGGKKVTRSDQRPVVALAVLEGLRGGTVPSAQQRSALGCTVWAISLVWGLPG